MESICAGWPCEKGKMAPQEDPERSLGICPASFNLTQRQAAAGLSCSARHYRIPQPSAGGCDTNRGSHPLGDPGWGLPLLWLCHQGGAGAALAPSDGKRTLPGSIPGFWSSAPIGGVSGLGLRQASPLPIGRNGAWSPSCPRRSCSSSKRRAFGNPSHCSSKPTRTSPAAPR